MYLTLNISKEISGILTAKKQELQKDFFILNKTFQVDEIALDHQKVSFTSQCIDNRYQAIYFKGPKTYEEIKIVYHGILDGTSGIYPYAKEMSTSNFILLRYETLYLPLFCGYISDEDFYQNFQNIFWHVHLTIEKSKEAYSSLTCLSQENNCYQFEGSTPVFMIARFDTFNKNRTTLLKPIEMVIDLSKMYTFIQAVFSYMNESYCNAPLDDLLIMMIPNGFGSFVMHHHLFLAENSWYNQREFIHELIHLGWNPNFTILSYKVGACRFFDEALTQYLMAEVYEYFYPNTIEETYKQFQKDFQNEISSCQLPIVPLTDFAKYNYGQLSYSYGPIVFKEIEKIAGKETLKKAIVQMIQKYQNQAIDFDSFINLFESDKTKQRIHELLYDIKDQERLLL